MTFITLDFPVITFENQKLLPAGTTLTPQILDNLISIAKSKSFRQCSFLEYGSIKKDVLECWETYPYNMIFSKKEHREALLDIMKELILPEPVLDSLSYFKIYDSPTYYHNLVVYVLTLLLSKLLIPEYVADYGGMILSPSHDIGKISIPISILKKDGPLTKDEFEHMKHHTVAGHLLLCYYFRDLNNMSAMLAKEHHEKSNGTGYPEGICQQNRVVDIVTTCDVYDALVSPRPYRVETYDNRTALEEIISMSKNKRMGWMVSKALISLNRKNKPLMDAIDLCVEERGRQPEGNRYGIISDKKK